MASSLPPLVLLLQQGKSKSLLQLIKRPCLVFNVVQLKLSAKEYT